MNPSTLFSISIAVLYAAFVADTLTTYVGIQKGMVERNPIMRPLINWYGKNTFRWFLGGGLGLLGVTFGLGELLSKIPTAWGTSTAFAGAAFEFYTAIHNYLLIRKLK